MWDKPGISSLGIVSRLLPTKPAPISSERPSPRMVSARPDATWLAASHSVMKANRLAITMPAAIAANTPTKALSAAKPAANPVTAPMIIMPSTPRLSTPERSATSSPIAAIRNGVDEAMMVRMMSCVSSMSRRPSRRNRRSQAVVLGLAPHQAEAVEDQGIAGEHVEQQQALDHLGDADRHFQRDLRRLAAEIGQG